MPTQFNAADFEQAAASFDKDGYPEVARLSRDRAAELRAQGDTSIPKPESSVFSREEIAVTTLSCAKTGQHLAAAQGRVLLGEMMRRGLATVRLEPRRRD